jgi:hypothetical protein
MLFVPGRLLVERERHPRFYEALRSARSRSTESRRGALKVLSRLASDPKHLAEVLAAGASSVPALLRRSAARRPGWPPEYRGRGPALLELAFGGDFEPWREGGPEGSSDVVWEPSQPHRLSCAPLSGELLPQEPPRAIGAWRLSVVAYCLAERVAAELGSRPAAVYFFFRDWLADQARVSGVRAELRAAAARLLRWTCGGDGDEELDAAASGAPPRPLAPGAPLAEMRPIRCELGGGAGSPEMHEFYPPDGARSGVPDGWKSARRGRPVNWMPASASARSEPFSVLSAPRSRASPLDLWAGAAASGMPPGSFYVLFDAGTSYLYAYDEPLARATLERAPAALALRSPAWGAALRARASGRLAPFLASSRARADAARGLCGLLFADPGELGDPEAAALLGALARYPDAAERLRRARREEVLGDSKSFATEAPGFLAAVYALRLPPRARALDAGACGRLRPGAARELLRRQLASGARRAGLACLSQGQVAQLYASADPELFESIVSLLPGRAALSGPPGPSESEASKDPEGGREAASDQLCRALYEAERPGRGGEARVYAAAELARADLYGVGPLAAFVARRRRCATSDPLYSAHPDAAPCLLLWPVSRVRVAPLRDTAEDMETLDFRCERDDSPEQLALEAEFDSPRGRHVAFSAAARAARERPEVLRRLIEAARDSG